MVKIAIVYATDHGNTQRMAEAVAAGVKTVPNAEALLIQAEDATEDEIITSNALIIGSPVHMSCLDWRVKRFIDQVCGPLWMMDRMVGKVGAAFASGGGYGNAGGGCEGTLLAMLTNLAEMGMILVPMPKTTPGYPHGGLQWGAYGRSAGVHMEQTGVTDERLEAAHHHGANVARVTIAIQGKELFAFGNQSLPTGTEATQIFNK
jgi:NAD(P)H dehydrogenase (quinone)